MSTVVERSQSESVNDVPVESSQTHGPDLNKLEDRTPDWLRMSRRTGGWTAVIGVLYLALSYQPLYHTDVWGHLSYGRWIWDNGQLPETEPLLPLSIGVPMVDTAWLSQVIGFGMFRQFGVTALQLLYAVPITAAFALLLWGVLRKTRGNILAGVLLLVTFGGVAYQQLLIVRPQLNGLMMFVGLFVLMNVCRWKRAFWVLVPLLFALWANLHGSWIVGLGLLGTMFVGRVVDVSRRTGTLRSVFADRIVRRLFALTELCGLAVLLNPYGFGLYPEVFAISGNPNLQDLIEWEPLTLRMSQGKAAAVAVLALMFSYRLSPRRVTATEVLLLTGLGGATLWSSRMIHWWAPVAAYYIALHGAAVWQNWRQTTPSQPDRNGLMSVVTIGLAWIFFAYTPFGFTLLHGQPTEANEQAIRLGKSTSQSTPITAAGYLKRHPVEGLVYNTYEWGDYLLFAGPPDLQLFTNSHAHLIPREVWQDSLTILRATNDWDDRLDRYGVNAVVLNNRRDDVLIRALKRENETWDLAFEDRTAVVFRRKRSI